MKEKLKPPTSSRSSGVSGCVWFRTKERLPDNEHPVLCWKFGTHPFSASYYGDRWWLNSTTSLVNGAVTHWMRMPEAPQD